MRRSSQRSRCERSRHPPERRAAVSRPQFQAGRRDRELRTLRAQARNVVLRDGPARNWETGCRLVGR